MYEAVGFVLAINIVLFIVMLVFGFSNKKDLDQRFISRKDVVDITGLSESTIRRLQKKNMFPKSYKISSRRIAWLQSDIEEWMSNVKTSDVEEAYEK